MKAKVALVFTVLALFSASLLHAQHLNPSPPTVPPAYACASGSENYGVIASYLNAGNIYKSTVLAPDISTATTYPAFEYYLSQVLALEQQQLAFLKSCKFNLAPFCQPGTEVLSKTTPAGVASSITAFDADQGMSAIQGFFAIPTPSAEFTPTEALNNFYSITEGAYCMLHPYTVHPDVVIGLYPPKFT
jgi:hypothetical protein